MAAVQNQRDLQLQATVPRLLPVPLPPEVQETIDAVRGVALSAPSTQFRTNAAGTSTSPSSITITARLTLVSGPVTWSVVSGTATLTGSGNSRTLTPANMGTDAVTIRASVTHQGTAYFADITIVRVRDGQSGQNGSSGTRGTVQLSTNITSGSWSDATANSLITSATGSALRVVGDLVTQVNNANGTAQTRRWSGSAWVVQDRYLSGNLLVGGDLGAQRFIGGSFIGAILQGSQEISVVNGGNFTLQGPGVAGNQFKSIYYGTSGVWDMALTLNQYGPTFLASATIGSPNSGSLTLNGTTLGGSIGNQIMRTGRTFWVNIGGQGAIQMYVGDPV